MSFDNENQSHDGQPVPPAARNPPGAVRRRRQGHGTKGTSQPPQRWATTTLGRMARRLGAVALALAAAVCAIAAYQIARGVIDLVAAPGGAHWGAALARAALAAGLALAAFRLMGWSASIELKLNVPGG